MGDLLESVSLVRLLGVGLSEVGRSSLDGCVPTVHWPLRSLSRARSFSLHQGSQLCLSWTPPAQLIIPGVLCVKILGERLPGVQALLLSGTPELELVRTKELGRTARVEEVTLLLVVSLLSGLCYKIPHLAHLFNGCVSAT